MEIFLNVLFLIIGMVLLIKGADFFVSGASAVAKKLKVPSIIIGLTIVAVGTSLPELAVSITSAIKGSVDLAVGNVVGSNIANMCLILGLSSIFNKIVLKEDTRKFDLPFLILVTGLLLLFSCDVFLDGATQSVVSRTESIVLLGLLVFYTITQIKHAKAKNQFCERSEPVVEKTDFDDDKKENTEAGEEKPVEKKEKELKVWQIVVYLIIGLAAVVFGGECVSSTAKFLALKAGMSEALVGLTIVAVGTSLPELATSIIAAKKGETDLALGNVIGSNIANIILILGLVGVITPMAVSQTILTDLLILFVFTLVFVFMSLRKKQVGKMEGIILLCMYISYITFAVVRNYCF